MFGSLRKTDALFLLAGVLYLLAGTGKVPFHGDESTHIFTGRDFYYLFLQRDFARVAYREPPADRNEQELRLLNGTVPRYLYGMSAAVSGYSIEELNGAWVWERNWDFNVRRGLLPEERLLFRARLMSALLLSFGLVVIYAVGFALGGRAAATLAALFYVLDPVLLMNGRRAMKEGGLVLFSLLTVMAGISFLEKRSWPRVALLGAVSGLAVAAKHSAALTVAAVFLGCLIYPFSQDGSERPVSVIPLPGLLRRTADLAGAGFLSVLVFFLLNPAWWGSPLRCADKAVGMHVWFLNAMVAKFGGFEGFGEKLSAFARHVFTSGLQYFEVAEWSTNDVIGRQISAYEKSPLRGLVLDAGWLEAVPLAAAVACGIAALFLAGPNRSRARWVVGTWAFLLFAATIFLTPVDWQRYYLPMRLIVALLASLGITQVFSAGVRMARRPSLG
jgi:MFS family permease